METRRCLAVPCPHYPPKEGGLCRGLPRLAMESAQRKTPLRQEEEGLPRCSVLLGSPELGEGAGEWATGGPWVNAGRGREVLLGSLCWGRDGTTLSIDRHVLTGGTTHSSVSSILL